MTGDHLFVISATCPLLSGSDVSDSRCRFQSCVRHFVVITVSLKANQSVALHVTLFVCIVTKRVLAGTVLVVIISS